MNGKAVVLGNLLINPQTQKKRPKRSGSEVISGIKWFYYLVPNDQCQSLTDEIGTNELPSKFLVCANVPNPKKDKGVTRLYAAFDSYLDFLHYARQIPMEKWHFFEIILGNQPQKLYFDIDIHSSEVEGNLKVFTQKLLTNLIGRIVDVFWAKNYRLDLAQNILLFSSQSSTNSQEPEKISYHLIVDGYAVSNCRENAVLVDEILDGFPEEYVRFLDTSMYSSKQQLRLYQSRKVGSDRPKIFVDEWIYGLETVRYQYPTFSAPNEKAQKAIEFSSLFMASCVTVVDSCIIIPILFEETDQSGVSRKSPSNLSETDDTELTDEIVQAVLGRIDPILFKIYKVSQVLGPLILLLRKNPAQCTLCGRVHEHENAFLRVNSTGKVYFYCRRNKDESKFVADVGDIMNISQDISKQHIQSLLNRPDFKLEPSSPPIPQMPSPAIIRPIGISQMSPPIILPQMPPPTVLPPMPPPSFSLPSLAGQKIVRPNTNPAQIIVQPIRKDVHSHLQDLGRQFNPVFKPSRQKNNMDSYFNLCK